MLMIDIREIMSYIVLVKELPCKYYMEKFRLYQSDIKYIILTELSEYHVFDHKSNFSQYGFSVVIT